MSTPERQQDSDPEKVSGYGGGAAPEPEQPDEGSELTDFEPDDREEADARAMSTEANAGRRPNLSDAG